MIVMARIENETYAVRCAEPVEAGRVLRHVPGGERYIERGGRVWPVDEVGPGVTWLSLVTTASGEGVFGVRAGSVTR